MARILVTGATGTCGRQTVEHLRSRDHEVRAGVRTPGAARGLAELGVEVVPLDLDDERTLGPAFAGVDRALLLTPFVEDPLPLLERAIVAARAEGVEHVVRLSAVGADPGSDVHVARTHGLGERAVQESGISWTILRPTFFMDNFVTFQASSIAANGAFYGASHGGRVAYVSAADIGAVAAEILARPEPHLGKTYELSGAEAFSDADAAARIGEAIGKEVAYVDLDADELAAGMRARGMPEWMVLDLLFLESVKAAGWAASVSEDVTRVTGRPPERFDSFLERNVSRFA